MPYTEFYCNASTGSNINAGDDKTVVTSTNGGWSTTTHTFTAASGTPFSGVVAGDMASIYVDGATVSACVGRITAVGGGGATLTLHSTARSGTAPTTAASGVSCTVGGKWKGPNGTDTFPVGFATNTMLNTTGNLPRINMQNEAAYVVSVGLTQNQPGMTYQGYTTTPGDLGKANIDGTGIGTAVVLFALSGLGGAVADLIFSNNGTSGNQPGLNLTGARTRAFRCVAYGIRGHGISMGSVASNCAIECEAYDCNKSNTASQGGFQGGQCYSCFSHDNSGSNNCGFVNTGVLVNCIADTNGLHGYFWTTNGVAIADGCDFYNNGTDGIRLADNAATSGLFRNCNFIKNGGYGIRRTATHAGSFGIYNCGFGAGTMANTSGTTTETAQSGFEIIGSVTYAADAIPWMDAPNGDFRLVLAASKGAGRGNFTQIQAGYSGAVGYPDIGAASAIATGGSGGIMRNPSLS